MISKKYFCHIINEIIKVNKKLDKLQDANSGIALSIVEEYSLQDELIDLLAKIMNLPEDPYCGNTIAWWVYDNDFGKKHLDIKINKNSIKVSDRKRLVY